MNNTDATDALDSLAAGLLRTAFVSHPILRTVVEQLAQGQTFDPWSPELTAMMNDRAIYTAALDNPAWSEWMLTARWDEDREVARLAYTLNGYRATTRDATDLVEALRVYHSTIVRLTHARALREADAL